MWIEGLVWVPPSIGALTPPPPCACATPQLLMRMREVDEEMLALHRADVVEVLGRGLTAALAPAFDDASGWADGAPPPSEPPP